MSGRQEGGVAWLDCRTNHIEAGGLPRRRVLTRRRSPSTRPGC